MDFASWAAAAGIGGVAFAAVVYILRDVIAAVLHLPKTKIYPLLRLIVVCSSILGGLGILAYVSIEIVEKLTRSAPATLPQVTSPPPSKPVPLTRTRIDELILELGGGVAAVDALQSAIVSYRDQKTPERWALVKKEVNKKFDTINKAREAINNNGKFMYAEGTVTPEREAQTHRLYTQLNDKENMLQQLLKQEVPGDVEYMVAILDTFKTAIRKELEDLRPRVANR